MAKVFEQKRLSNRMRYAFEDETLHVTQEDASSAVEFTIPYTDIPFESTQYTEKMEALKGISMFFIAVAALALLAAFQDPTKLIVVVVLLGLAGLAVIGYRRFRPKFTVIPTERGKMLILHDEHHDSILGELESRRRVLLRKLFLEIDTDNDPHHELRKFEWLRQNGVITEEEFTARAEEIDGKPRPKLPPSSKTVH